MITDVYISIYVQRSGITYHNVDIFHIMYRRTHTHTSCFIQLFGLGLWWSFTRLRVVALRITLFGGWWQYPHRWSNLPRQFGHLAKNPNMLGIFGSIFQKNLVEFLVKAFSKMTCTQHEKIWKFNNLFLSVFSLQKLQYRRSFNIKKQIEGIFTFTPVFGRFWIFIAAGDPVGIPHLNISVVVQARQIFQKSTLLPTRPTTIFFIGLVSELPLFLPGVLASSKRSHHFFKMVATTSRLPWNDRLLASAVPLENLILV